MQGVKPGVETPVRPVLKWLKVLLRSRSLAFARAYTRRRGPDVAQLVCACDRKPIHYRPATSDAGVIYDVLLKEGRKAEYWLPGALEARTIFDIGANIGATARYLANLFPRAAIHCFEPVPSNLELLRRNTSGIGRVHVHPYALGETDGEVQLHTDEKGINAGSYSMFAGGSGGVRCAVRSMRSVLSELGNPQPDIIKIDTEGAEYLILSAFPRSILERVAWVYGELHSHEPNHFKVLDLLARTHWVEVHKPMFKRNYFFDACRLDLRDDFRAFRRR